MLFFLMLLLTPLSLLAETPASNVLIYTDPVQVSSSINAYENIVAGVPIEGTVMVTHQESSAVDPSSFRIGSKPLKVEFVQIVAMSDYSNLVISFYSFKLEGMNKGQYTLDPINVKVGGKVYQAPPLTIQVG
ncbi:MAG: BatD family protein [Parachlamydia sp.]|nr:BatD family protein [Parachlamydia sp.]